MRFNEKFASGILTLTLGSALAFAQGANPGPPPVQTPAPKTDAHGQGSHSADHGMSTNKGAGLMVGKGDQEFITKAAQSGMMEIEAGRLAQEKATSTEVKEFARKVEQDHLKATEQLKELAAQKNVELPADMGKHQEMVDKIRNLSGDEFDKAFMKMQVQHHKKSVSTYQKQTERAMDSDVRAFASTTLPTLQQHLSTAQELQGSTRGRKADTRVDSTTDSKAPPQPPSDSSKTPSDNLKTPIDSSSTAVEKTAPAPAK